MLLILGLAWMLIGLGVFTSETPPAPVPGLFHTYIPVPIRFGLWAGTGLVAIFHAWSYKDAVGWLALYILPAERILSYIIGWSISVFHLGPGYPRGWYSAIFYGVMVAIVLVCAGWPEPAEPPNEEELIAYQEHQDDMREGYEAE